MEDLTHREQGGIPGDQQTGWEQQIQMVGVFNHQPGMHLGDRELTKRQHRHHRQQHHDQQRLDEIGSNHRAHAAEQRVNRCDADHHHHAHVIVEARKRLEQQTGPHGLGHQKTQGVNGGDHHEHPPGQASVAQPNEVTTGAPIGHQLLDA